MFSIHRGAFKLHRIVITQLSWQHVRLASSYESLSFCLAVFTFILQNSMCLSPDRLSHLLSKGFKCYNPAQARNEQKRFRLPLEVYTQVVIGSKTKALCLAGFRYPRWLLSCLWLGTIWLNYFLRIKENKVKETFPSPLALFRWSWLVSMYQCRTNFKYCV